MDIGVNMRYKIGDKVRIIRDRNNIVRQEMIGKVAEILYITGMEQYAIKFEQNVNGHYLDGNCEQGYGWYLYFTQLEAISELAVSDLRTLYDASTIKRCA